MYVRIITVKKPGIPKATTAQVPSCAPLSSEGRTVGIGDAAAQARRCLEIVADILERLATSISDTVRTRILLTRIEDWKAVGQVYGEFFNDVPSRYYRDAGCPSCRLNFPS